jgi:hypothetical protein
VAEGSGGGCGVLDPGRVLILPLAIPPKTPVRRGDLCQGLRMVRAVHLRQKGPLKHCALSPHGMWVQCLKVI